MYILILIVVGSAIWYVYEKKQRPTHAVAPGLHEEIEIPHTREWEVYHNQISLCSKKLRVCMAELGLPYESHHIDLIETRSYENLSREFLKINPGFTVPVLIHNGHPIYESHEQIVYAAEHAGSRGKALLGSTPEMQDEIAQWIDETAIKGDPLSSDRVTAGNAAPGLTIPIFTCMLTYIPWWRVGEGLLFHGDRRRPLAFSAMKARGIHKLPPPIQTLIRKARTDMSHRLDKAEECLKDGRHFICGESFTLADVGWMAILERIDEVDWIPFFFGDEKRPRTLAYWKRLKERPSYEAALGQRGAIHLRALED
ncbi:MAG: glutathione S-transferase family protein, partial [Myxococcota bacterium]|nr:glutathione S-transferase family protein [Myxococcota bacterium]